MIIRSIASPIFDRVVPAKRSNQAKAMKKSLNALLIMAFREFTKMFDDDWFIVLCI